MNKHLKKLFEALGLKGWEDLKPTERASYERYETMLRAEVKPEDLRKYLGLELNRLRLLREDEAAIPGDRIDQERLAQIRVVRGMIGQYVAAENQIKQAEAEIEQAINKIKSNNK